ncbi:nucleoside hydrolase-like domain-containing protein [Nonomuraea wenchangensis]
MYAAADADPGRSGLSRSDLRTIEEQSQKRKINTILTTDGEHDDMASMVRYLAMANEFNTKGIILGASAAGHHTGGTIHYPPGAKIMTPQQQGSNPNRWTKNFQTAETSYDDGTVKSRTYRQNRWTGFTWIPYYLDKYAQVYPNLVKHDPDYPTPGYLRSIYKYGNIKVVGEMDEVTQGSEWIKKTILENPDGEPLYIQHWGGTNTTARALRSIKEQYENTPEWPRILKKINSEVTLYLIWGDQAPTYDYYIAPNWPGIRTIMSQDQFFGLYRTWTQPQRHDAQTQATWFGKAWTDTIAQIGSPLTSESLIRTPYCLDNANIQNPAHKFYTPPVYSPPFTPADDFPFATWGDSGSCQRATDGRFDAEGDTGSFLYLVDNGLRSYDHPSWGGLAGRFGLSDPDRPNEYRDVKERAGSPNAGGSGYTPVEVDVPPAGSTVLPKNWTFSRWVPDIQAAYSVHAQWSVTGRYQDANHHPKSGVTSGLDVPVVPGRTVNLKGVAYDPDGDRLTYKWWRYADVDTLAGTGTIDLANKKDATFTIPADAKTGDTVHLIFEVSDSPGNQPYTSLKTYKRVVLTVVSYDDLSTAVQKWADDGQLSASLARKLRAFVDEAREQTSAGNVQSADGALRAFLHHIGNANSRRASAEAKAALVNLATTLRSVLREGGGIPADR